MAKRNLLFGGIAVLILAAVVAVVVASPFRSHMTVSANPPSSPSQGAGTTASSPPISTTTSPSLAPSPPAHGAYFGAWVGAPVFTQANEISAVDELQQQLGRKLSIVHTYLQWQAPFPTTSDLTFLNQGSMLLISWAGTDTQQINSGADDAWIRTRALQIKALGKPVFLEWRWEMDRPNLRAQMHSGADFVQTWDRIRRIFATAGVQNAAWVWCPTANGFSDGQAAAFYPGNSEVDWVCADAYPTGGSHVSLAATLQPFLSWAAPHGKPVMIGEFGVPESFGAAQRAQWLRAAAQVVHGDQQIKAVLYFDANPAGRGPQGSYSLTADSAPLAAFRAMARQPYFNPAGGK